MKYLYNQTHQCEYLGTYAGNAKLTDCATEVPPPEVEPGKVPCFNQQTNAWDTIIPDYRGATIYSKANSLVTKQVTLAGEIDKDYVAVIPPDTTSRYIWSGSEWTLYTPPAPEPPDQSAFLEACERFRAVCADIGALLGVEDFRGGFDEMQTFQASEMFNTMPGLRLAIEWSAANELCKYEGAKIGLGQPQWWYECWKVTPEP